jgi:hypothetical protein
LQNGVSEGEIGIGVLVDSSQTFSEESEIVGSSWIGIGNAGSTSIINELSAIVHGVFFAFDGGNEGGSFGRWQGNKGSQYI